MSSSHSALDPHSISGLLQRAAAPDGLSADEAESAFHAMMERRLSPVQAAALLITLRTRGETPAEVAGGVRALRRSMVPVPVSQNGILVDTCGTGGGRVTTFNISTVAALVAAAGGARIAKHGNRSYTSRCGSADVLEALGVRIDLTPEAMAAVLEEAGIVFMFAPLLHPAMRNLGPVRGELAVTTVMNLLGPLTNPAGVRHQVVGVQNPAHLELVAYALRELGHRRALVVHGEPGMDELSPLGATEVVELSEDEVRRYSFDPKELGWPRFEAGELAGGEIDENARIVLDIIAGKGTAAARAAVALNAGAALYVAKIADSLEDGVAEAERILDAGAAREVLEKLCVASHAAR